MRYLCLVLAAGFLLAAAVPVLAAPQAICVRWQASEGRAHPTYSGKEITLKGVARGGATEFRWDYGDGGSTAWAPITDSYNLGVKHAYTDLVGTEFTATLHVKDAEQEATDTYPVKIYLSADLAVPEELDVRRDVSIDEGLWYLHTHLVRGSYGGGAPGYGQPYGNWLDVAYGSHMAATGASLNSFHVNGHKLIGDYDGDPYVETVRRATNYVLVNTYSYAISQQPAGNPDTNGNGIGLGYLYDSSQVYVGGICTTALASSGSPNYTAPVGANNVYGRTILDIVQDMVDFFAWGQNDPSSGMYRGGWRYYANLGSSDMSATQWPPQAMMIAREEMGTMIPAFVGTELVLYLDAMQSTHLDNDNGNFGYTGVDQFVNIKKTAAGIICHEFLGTPWTDPRVQKALGFIYRHWNDNGGCWDYTELHGNSYELYGVMMAFRAPNPDVMQVPGYDYNTGNQTGNSFNWYYTPAGQANQGLATYLVGSQQADGGWDDTVGCDPVYDAFCTGWRILTLSGAIDTTPEPSSAVIGLHNLQWGIPYMIDESQTVLGQPQGTSPRDNRGLAISPDGRYLYAGYNNGPEVRKLDLTQIGYTAMTIARTTVSRGKAIAVDDEGRVYLAEGGAIKIMDANLAGVHYTITGAGVVTKCEGVAVTRESGKLVLYDTERGVPNTLTRWELTESGGQVTNAVRAGLDGDGVITITGASDMRGCAVDWLGRIWIADPLATTGTGKVFRVNNDGTGLVSVDVGNPYAISFNGKEVVVTGGYQRLVTVLNSDLSGSPWTFTVPWTDLELDPDGQGNVGMLSGIAFAPNGGGFYLTNEGGQTANEKSTYGTVDGNSGWQAGKFYTDLYNDDNDPILYATFGSISEAKLLPNDTPVTVSAAIVSAAWTDVFYIEADDRSSGIRVEKAAHGLTDDNVRADVAGILKTNSDGERYIHASTADPAGSGSVEPLGMVNQSLGGGDLLDPITGIGQLGVKDGKGVNNIGLLVQIWGRVTEIESVVPPALPTWFKIDDGSGVNVKCVVPDDVTIDPDWDYVVVTGASSCEKTGDDLYRLIRVREDSDITPY